MKTQRLFASLCLAVSCCALLAAANVSLGDQPGVVRLTAGQDTDSAPAPVPPAGNGQQIPVPRPDNSVPLVGGDFSAGPAGGQPPFFNPQGPGMGGMPMNGAGPGFVPPQDYAPYMQQSGGVTESPVLGRRPFENPLFGPQLTFESNIDDGLGYGEAYHRLNSRIPYHVVPGNTVLMADLAASISNDNEAVYNLGVIWRNFDASRNRIFGWNAYWDSDGGRGNRHWKRVGFGMESLGRFLDFRVNGYVVNGTDSVVLTDQLLGDLMQTGNTVTRLRNQTRDNAYSGVDAEVGGPLPYLGRRGINGYVGGYWLDNDYGFEATGFSARLQALLTESATVGVTLTTDDTFGTNSWATLSYTIPNYGERRILQPKTVRERLADPVHRSNRIHTNIDTINVPEALLNPKTGVAWNLIYVDPNATGPGTGTFEDPYGTMELANANNSAAIDVIQVTPRADDTSTNLTVSGGLTLFDCQHLVSNVKDYTLFTEGGQDFVLPGRATATGLGALIQDPNMVAGGSVIRVANENTIFGMRIDASDEFGTAFGTGISNPLPITDTRIICNIFTNYDTAVDLQDVSGRIVLDENTASGIHETSDRGMVLTTGSGSAVELLIRNNTVNNSRFTDFTGQTENEMLNLTSTIGISVLANANSTIRADDPNGLLASGETGILNNTVTNSGDGIVVAGNTGSEIHLRMTNNTSSGNSGHGFVARTDGGIFNLVHFGENTLSNNTGNGAILHYLNGGQFFAMSEDLNEDIDLDGMLDAGEDVDMDGVLDLEDGLIGSNEDLNGNGLVDQGIVTNTFSGNTLSGLLLLGEDDSTGFFDIGGELESLGNQLSDNANGGIVGDLRDMTVTHIDAVNNRTLSGAASAEIIRTGFDQNVLAANDDGSTGQVAIGFDANFFGQQFTDLFVNNNGNVTFNSALGTFTPFPLLTTATPIIAPFFADVDTRAGNETTFGTGIVDGRAAFGVNWLNVRHFSALNANQGLPENSFQLVLIDRSDIAPGDFDIEFNYDQILWEAGEASGSDIDGLGGSTARVGFTNGVNTAFELPGSAVPGAFLDSGPAATSLVNNSFNSSTLGRYVFEARNGNIATSISSPNADAVRMDLSGNARIVNGRFLNNSFARQDGSGIEINATGNASVDRLVLQGNNVANSRLDGISLTANGPMATINTTIGGIGTNVINGQSFSQGNVSSGNGQSGAGDGFRIRAANGGTIRGSLQGNEADGNSRNGATLIAEDGTLDFGTMSDRLISNNTLTNNTGAGLEIISNATAGNFSQVDAVVQANTITGNAGGGVVASMSGFSAGGVTNNELNLTLGGTTAEANTIDQNGVVGVGFSVADNAKGNLTMRNAAVTNSTGDGISLTRSGSSLLTATIENVTSTGHTGDGLSVDMQGNDRSDPSQPMSGTINTVTWNNNEFRGNGENGATFRVRGDAQLIADGSNNVVSENTTHGVEITTSETSSFGDPTQGLPPGQRSVINGLVANDNGVDGVSINATEDSRVLVEITSNQTAPTAVGFQSGNVLNGDTTISGSGSDGVHITTTGGASDVLITSGTGQTTITANGDADNNGDGTPDGGNGIRWDASGDSSGTVRITNTLITGNIAGASEDTNGNGILDAGEDTNNNEDIDVADGDGVQYNVTDIAQSTLIIGGVGAGNVIQSNADDGIAITATGDQFAASRPVIAITDNTIGGTSGGVAAGNGGDGVSLNIFGGTADVADIGADPANIDTDIGDGDGLSFSNGVTEAGPIVQLTLSGNSITNNTQRGVNLSLVGAAGTRNRENGNSVFDPVRITMTGNTISANGTEGVFFRGDSDMNQGRLTYLANFPFPNPPFNPADDRPQNGFFYNPGQPEFLADNAGSVNGNSAYSQTAPDGEQGYLNLRTVQNSLLTITGNTIQNNGTGTVTGEGIVLKVGTGSYLAADIRGNTLGGNLEEDLRTESFLSADNTYDSVDDAGDLTFDAIYHDDTAQLDLRFSNNTGNQIFVTRGGEQPGSEGATYTNRDALKELALGFTPTNLAGVTDRDVALFQVDDGANLNNPNNAFISFGQTQDINAAFSAGGFNIRAAADAAFPNIGFAPFLP